MCRPSRACRRLSSGGEAHQHIASRGRRVEPASPAQTVATSARGERGEKEKKDGKGKCRGLFDADRSAHCAEAWDEETLCPFSTYLQTSCPVRCQSCTSTPPVEDLDMLAQKYWLVVDLRLNATNAFRYGCLLVSTLARSTTMGISSLAVAEDTWTLLESQLDAMNGGKEEKQNIPCSRQHCIL